METKALIVIKSVNQIMRTEDLIEDITNYRIIPTPREITKSCGMSVLFDLEDIEEIKSVLDEKKIDYINIYKYKKEGRDLDLEVIY